MCRWKGCTHPPPPFLISQKAKLFCLGGADGVFPAGFCWLVRTFAGSNGLPLISHSISPPALPRFPSKISRFFIRSFHFGEFGVGTDGRSRSFVVGLGITLSSVSGGGPSMTIFIIGTL